MKLKRCPCGEVPNDICISDCGQGGKWMLASGTCCGEWSTEFRSEYYADGSLKLKKLAMDAWNEAPRNTRAIPDLKWTTDPPIRPGWYWVKEFKDSVPLIFEYREPEDLSCYAFVSVFAGPLPEPEEA